MQQLDEPEADATLNNLPRAFVRVLFRKFVEPGLSWNSALKVSTFLGACIIFSYATLVLNFFPNGVGIGDGLIFILAATLTGGMLLIFTLVGIAAFFALIQLPDWKKLNNKQRSIVLVSLLAVVLCLFLAVNTYAGHRKFQHLLGILSLASILIVLAALLDRPDMNEKYRIPLWLMLIVLTLQAIPSVLPRAINFALQSLGIRTESASVYLSEENFKLVQRIAIDSQIAVDDCGPPKDEKPPHRLDGVTVLWHGVGDKSIISLPYYTSALPSFSRITLKSEGITIIKNLPDRYRKCLKVSVLLSGSDTSKALSTFLEAQKRVLNSRLLAHEATFIQCSDNFDLAPIMNMIDQAQNYPYLGYVETMPCSDNQKAPELTVYYRQSTFRPIDYEGFD